MDEKSLLALLKIVGPGVMGIEAIEDDYDPTEVIDLVNDLGRIIRESQSDMAVCAAAFLITRYMVEFNVSDVRRSQEPICICDLEEMREEYEEQAEQAIHAQLEKEDDCEEFRSSQEKFSTGEAIPPFMEGVLGQAQAEVDLAEAYEETMTELDATFDDVLFVAELVESCFLVLSDETREDAHRQVAKLLEILKDRCLIGRQAIVQAQMLLKDQRQRLINQGTIVYVSAYLDFEL